MVWTITIATFLGTVIALMLIFTNFFIAENKFQRYSESGG